MRESDGVLDATSPHAARALEPASPRCAMSVRRRHRVRVRRALELGHGAGARIVAGGQPITITGGHTWYSAARRMARTAAPQGARDVQLGADFIKVMATGGGTVSTMSWLPSFSPGELVALADEAHRRDGTSPPIASARRNGIGRRCRIRRHRACGLPRRPLGAAGIRPRVVDARGARPAYRAPPPSPSAASR